MSDPVGALARILPGGAAGAELLDDGGELPEILDGERPGVLHASPARVREFTAGRACAREALALIGEPPTALPVGDDGAPVWPDGVVGSITHKGLYRAAAAAPATILSGLGIDAEHDEKLPEGLLASIALPAELVLVESLLESRPGLAWDRLLFSAKEAAVKAARGFARRRPDLRRSEVHFDDAAGGFAVQLGFASEVPARPLVRGRWARRDGLLLAVAWARPPGRLA